MIHYIENEYLRVGVKEYGCEIASIYSKGAEFEYLWQGDESIWYGQAPILFPIIGRLIEDKYTYEGTVYDMPKHGFARKTDWTLVSNEGDKMTWKLTHSEDTLKIYPFRFELTVEYALEGKSLSVRHTVNNLTDGDMYFSLGAHPAFNCRVGDKLIFSENETLDKIKIDLEKSLRLPETFPMLRDEREIVITEDIFCEDALIFKGVKSEKITLDSTALDKKIVFSLGGAPYLGIWAKPGAPYVCIEPWYGVNDGQVPVGDFSEKEGINKLEKGESFNFTWKAEFSD